MFDLGFSELMLVAIVALVVLGPERLPKATRFAGVWIRRARQQWSSVKDEFEKDMASDELKQTMKEAREAVRDTRQSMKETVEQARDEIEQARTMATAGMAVGATTGDAGNGVDETAAQAQAEDDYEQADEGRMGSASELVYEEDDEEGDILTDEDGPAQPDLFAENPSAVVAGREDDQKRTGDEQ